MHSCAKHGNGCSAYILVTASDTKMYTNNSLYNPCLMVSAGHSTQHGGLGGIRIPVLCTLNGTSNAMQGFHICHALSGHTLQRAPVEAASYPY